MTNAYRDENSIPTLIASSNVDGQTPVRIYADPVTHRLLVDSNGAGSGTVTSVSVVTANGLAGTVATPTITPAITLTTSVTGILQGNGTAISAATTTGTGSVVLNTKPTFIGTIQTVTAMGAQAINGSLGNVFTRTLASSETFTQSNFSTGQFFVVEVTNAAGGGDTVTWFSGITWVTSGGTAPVQASGASGITTYGFRCTGTNTFLGYLVGTN